LPEAEASQVIAFATGGLIPDLTVVLTVDLDLSLKRLGGRRDINRIDAETKEFHRSIHRAYQDLCGSHWAKSWLMIDTTPGAMTPAVVAQGVVDRIVRELDSA
jgi:dTMP kinase